MGFCACYRSGQSSLTLAETAHRLETDGTEMATSSSDTSLTGLRMVSLTSMAALQLAECRLTSTVTDNSGVSGTRTTMQVPLKEVDAGGVRVVARPDGYRDFTYIPGKHFATIPARNAEAAGMLMAAMLRAGELCGAGAPQRQQPARLASNRLSPSCRSGVQRRRR